MYANRLHLYLFGRLFLIINSIENQFYNLWNCILIADWLVFKPFEIWLNFSKCAPNLLTEMQMLYTMMLYRKCFDENFNCYLFSHFRNSTFTGLDLSLFVEFNVHNTKLNLDFYIETFVVSKRLSMFFQPLNNVVNSILRMYVYHLTLQFRFLTFLSDHIVLIMLHPGMEIIFSTAQR